jgi:2-C-methyl-D-erythritol 4-phosphate cytidylyltransferase
MHSAVIVVAAGRGTRMRGTTAKAFVPLGGTPMIVYPLRTLTQLCGVSSLILVVGSEYIAHAQKILDRYGPWPVPIQVTRGGAERQDSVAAGLALVEAAAELVIVHDAARPFVSLACVEACVAAAVAEGAAIVALPVRDTVKVAADHTITQTLDRRRIWLAQTPQAFRTTILRDAYAQARREGVVVTDDAALVERLGATVRIVPGEPTNQKITTPDDLRWAEWYVTTRDAALVS